MEISINGITKTSGQWAMLKSCPVNKHCIERRIKQGFPAYNAVFEPSYNPNDGKHDSSMLSDIFCKED